MKKGSMALRLFLYASLVSLLWLGSYVALSEVFTVRDMRGEKPVATPAPAVDLPVPVTTKWSVLAVRDEAGDVTEFLFRYADFLADSIVFIRVPVDTKTELLAGGYEVLRVHNPELPELFMISDLCRIFSEETWCMAAEEVGAALLGVRPKECYVIEETLYEAMTETIENEVCFKKPQQIREILISEETGVVTDAAAREEVLYWESYLDVDTVRYLLLPGKASAEEYVPDADGIRLLVEQVQMGIFEEVAER